MAFAQGSPSDLRKDNDFEHKLLSYYFNVNRIPCLISSPFRMDSDPSLSITSTPSGHVKWKDFGTGDGGNIWLLLSKTWHMSVKEVEKKVLKDTPDILSREHNTDVLPSVDARGKIVHKTDTEIGVKVRAWREYDLVYWQDYGISRKWLEFGDIYPISHIIITKNKITYPISADKYAYVFVEFKDGEPSLKIYQPFSREYKWISRHDRSVWDLWSKLPQKGDTLIITSSRKDALCVWSNTGIPCTGLQGEGYMPKLHVMAELLNRFKDIYILYDNDFRSEMNYGREYGKKIADTFGLKQIEIPTSYRAKDPSDLYHAQGRETLRSVIFALIQREEQGDIPF